ncbi:MAG TPA: SpoIIE family protein phosphatase [Pyrinomonadaceae bacterium]|jgi:serine phosphatase RsbU (regulator of sigma subunit)
MNELPLKEAAEITIFDVGLTVAFGVLHLLLYLFYPRQRANLFFSLFAMSAAVRVVTADVLDISRFPDQTALILNYIALWSIGAAVFSFVAFLYAAFKERIPIHFWIVLSIWTLGVITRLFYSQRPTLLLQFISLLIIAFIAVESLRVVGRALLLKRDGAWIVGLGVLLLIVSPLQNGLVILTGRSVPHFWNVLFTQISLCGIIIANSVFLARSFAQTNKNLEEQLFHVKDLSARELEHERTAAELRLQNEQERARLALVEQELALAANIQQALFPEKIPHIEGFDIAAFNRPARVCGGDYYDILAINEPDVGTSRNSTYLLCVADVAGKGLPAALLMSNMQATLRALAGGAASLRELAARTNDLLHATSPANKFVTAILVEINPATSTASYVNAGHNECFVLRRGQGTMEALKSTGLPLGMFAGMSYEENSFQLEAGDLLALFSDGVPEAQSKNEQEWGEANLHEYLARAKDGSAQSIINQIICEIDRFADGVAQHDDITLLILKSAG